MSNLHLAVLGVIVIISPFLMVGVWVFVAYRYLDRIESILSNSRMVAVNREIYSHAGLLGKVMRLGSVSAMLSMKYFSVRKGLLDNDEVTKVPIDLQRLLVRLWIIQILLIALIVLFFIWIEYWR
ncbi:hypothetical protein [Pseudomonas sp. GD03746]|uniref:Uncharacterized protein n=1 Tax=Pseudomonas putida (strain W619) TaxID=390235 RepID=B1JAH8_PSEPW|nr:hypothetical protein [Pseudomonas sp. GD03746]MDH1575992.1 hypothetical protein [Pseudomonas sp. GD03746]HEN8714483.1 hypothetical protein [Pseudomonas putida]HEN8719740.1 hypothetical protein [Pseudomonas putida]